MHNDSQRVELSVTLEQPGIVVLADVFDRGWKLSIDGVPAEILKVNSMMRGAAVEAGTHMIVYEYEPASLQIGIIVSITGLVMLGATVLWARIDTRASRA